MDERVREVAARVRPHVNNLGNSEIADRNALAEWALPLLDNEPLTRAWMDAVLPANERHNWTLRRSTPLTIEIEESGGGFWVWFCHDKQSPVPTWQLKTRGQLRTLALALGIPLKPEAP